jgi:hypothetical protein
MPYADFKTEVINDMQKGTSVQLDDLKKMYVLASRWVAVKTGKDGGGAFFATGFKKKGSDKNTTDKNQGSTSQGAGNANSKNEKEKQASKLAKMKCFNCDEKGHPAKNCPPKEWEQDSADDPPLSGSTLDLVCSTSDNGGGRIHEFYEVCIENGSQVNIVNQSQQESFFSVTQAFQQVMYIALTKLAKQLLLTKPGVTRRMMREIFT